MMNSIAELAVAALKWEANFTPKPGLVDAVSNGAHQDMDVTLFRCSATSLSSYFESIVQVSSGATIDRSLRTKIGALGRQAEATMYQTTNGVNTHKGAIWTLGLLVSSLAITPDAALADILTGAAALASLPDEKLVAPKKSYGEQAQQKYGLGGAKAEAQQAFPHIAPLLQWPLNSQDDWLRVLLQLYATVDDTNIVHRADLATLRNFQKQAQQIVADEQPVLANSRLRELDRFTLKMNISPGGSADLFAAIRFLTWINIYREEHESSWKNYISHLKPQNLSATLSM